MSCICPIEEGRPSGVRQEFVSLDGLVAGPNDSVDFIPASTHGDPSFGQEQLALMGTTDTLLLGRADLGQHLAGAITDRAGPGR